MFPCFPSVANIYLIERATQLGNLDEVRRLIADKTQANQVPELGHIALGFARSGDIADALIDAKADVNGTNYSRRTPLHWAARQGQYDVVCSLIAAKADVTLADSYGQTPLTLAAGNNRILRALLLSMSSQ